MLKIWHYKRQVAVYEKNRNVYITCMHTTHNASQTSAKKPIWRLAAQMAQPREEREFMNINQKMLQQQIIMQKEYDWHKIN